MGVVEVLDPVAQARAGGGSVDVSRGEQNGRCRPNGGAARMTAVIWRSTISGPM
ncbi:MAG TPA: hypothetical protein VIN17_13395 [Paracoccaceae bacterium]